MELPDGSTCGGHEMDMEGEDFNFRIAPKTSWKVRSDRGAIDQRSLQRTEEEG